MYIIYICTKNRYTKIGRKYITTCFFSRCIICILSGDQFHLFNSKRLIYYEDAVPANNLG